MRSRDFTTPRGVHGKIDLTVPGGGTSSLGGAGRVAREGEDARRDLGSRYRMLDGGRAVCVYLGRGWDGKRDALVIEIVVEFIVESLDILERRNDLLQIVVLKSRVNNKPPMDGRP
jgi:hypothetical protein